MQPFDLFGLIINALVALPAQFLAVYHQNPDQWNLIGLMMAALIALGWLAPRPRRRRSVR